MQSFRYKAVNDLGKTIRGSLDANDEMDLEKRLAAMDLDLVIAKPIVNYGFSFGKKRVTRRDLITFCFHLEQQMQAGIPLLDGLKDLRDSVDSRGLKEVTASLIEEIDSGKSLSQALAEFPNTFNSVFVSLVMAGERSGKIAEILQELSDDLKWQDEIIAQAKKAAMYPLFVAIAVCAVIVSLMIFLVPELIKFISNMGQELPLHTRILIMVSDGLRNYGHYVLLAFVGLILVFLYLYRFSEKWRYGVDVLKLKIWIIGPVQQKLILSRFTHNFALLYEAGITVLDCLTICEGIVGNKVFSKSLKTVGKNIADGKMISESFERTGLFPRLVIRMLKVGETTGALDKSLANIGYFYNRDVKEALDRLQNLIGPTMTVIMGLVLGWVILSVLGPIYNTLSTVTF